jgi:hypothetical protein
MSEDNRERRFCEYCDKEILVSGEGHAPECRTNSEDVEYVRVQPAPYLIDEKGRYFANWKSGWKEARRIHRTPAETITA